MPPSRHSPIRVLLASPRELLRSGLAALVRGQPQIELVGTTGEPPSAANAFDVLVWDVAAVEPRLLPLRFLALLPNHQNARAWLDAGASGILLETSSVYELLDAIRQVSRGETYFPPALTHHVLAIPRPVTPNAQPLVEPLTEREREVLQLLAQGLSNKAIAQKLYVSVRTVEGHLANLYGKLQVKSRTEAALWVLQNR